MAKSVKINDEMKGCIQSLAELRHRSARESFKREALASWASFQETGQHLTGPEVRAWLNTLGTDDVKAVPECHE